MKRKDYANARSVKVLIMALLFFTLSCNEFDEVQTEASLTDVSAEIIEKLEKAGFVTSEGLRKFRDGYLVETDIYLTEEQIDQLISEGKNELATEHYRTFNLVNGARTIRIFMDPAFDNFMQNAFNAALARYNALNLRLEFVRENNENNADIVIDAFFENSNLLGFSAGFPVGGGPASPIGLNTLHYNGTNRTDATTVIAHEIGHAIGYRHTDFMNRVFSCGQEPGINPNEGAGTVGAVHVPGTPTGPEANSWMLACSNNTDRPFTNNDRTALNEVYGFGINGTDLVCNSNNTFTLTGAPVGSTITWQASPSTAFDQASGSGASAVLNASSNFTSSSGTLTYTITSNGLTFTVSTNFWVGRPGTPSSLFGPATVNYGAIVRYNAGVASGASSYKWYLPYPYDQSATVIISPLRWGILSGGTSRYLRALVGPNDGLVQVMGVNACGTGGARIMNVTVVTSGGGGAIP